MGAVDEASVYLDQILVHRRDSKPMSRGLFIFFLVLLVTACDKHPRSAATTRSLLERELRWLKNNSDPKAAVIFEEEQTKKFVQFCARELFVDLPHQTLSAEEMSRAEVVMAKFGVQKYSYPLGGGATPLIQTAFQKDLAGDERAAIEIAEAVFKDVFRFQPDARIRPKRI